MLPHAIHRIPPLVIVCNSEFISFDSDCDSHLWLTPDNMRLSTAFVIYDVDGILHRHYGGIFDNNGYTVKVLNLADIKESLGYNPFLYIRSDRDIPKLVNAIMTGTKGHGEYGDLNFKLAESMLLTALISYLHDEAPTYEQNLNMLLTVLKFIDIDKDEEGYRYAHAIDCLIDNKEADDPYHLSVRQYRKFEDMTGDNPENVIASCIARLSMLDTEEMSGFLVADELYFDELYSSKTVLFITPGKADAQINFIIPLLYSQLLDVLCEINVIPSASNPHEYECE